MKHILLSIFAFIAICVYVSAAPNTSSNKFELKKIDFNDIKEQTMNPKSKYYFPKLMKSFMSNDTVMSFDEYRYFYYGYMFQEDYSPFRTSDFTNTIEPYYYKKSYTRADCDTIEKYAALSLDDNIFDLRQMKFYIFALKQKKKYARASIRQFRLNHILAAILSSGNGTKENPWVVNSVEHEYNILNFLGFVATSHKEMGNDIDYITIDRKGKDSKTPEGYYFDISQVMKVANRKFPDHRK